MSLSRREMHTPTPYTAQPQPQPQLSPIESYRPLQPDSARSSRAPTPQLGAFSRLGLEGIGGVPSRRDRSGSVDSGPPRSAAELFLASSMPKQTASEKVLAAISGAYGVIFPAFNGAQIRRARQNWLAITRKLLRIWRCPSVLMGSEWGHHVSDQLAQVMLENKSLRDQLHELQTGQRALATKQEVTEEITAQRESAEPRRFDLIGSRICGLAR